MQFGSDCGMLEFFKYSTHELSSKNTIADSPAFLGPGLAEKIAVCAYTEHTTRLPKKNED